MKDFFYTFNNIVSLSISIICLHLAHLQSATVPGNFNGNANLYPPDSTPFYPPMGSLLKYVLFSFYKIWVEHYTIYWSKHHRNL
jgi:hypothetical protein